MNFVDDGIRIEPFNLEQEREEGYFDANGNFVEYRSKNEIKVIFFFPPPYSQLFFLYAKYALLACIYLYYVLLACI